MEKEELTAMKAKHHIRDARAKEAGTAEKKNYVSPLFYGIMTLIV